MISELVYNEALTAFRLASEYSYRLESHLLLIGHDTLQVESCVTSCPAEQPAFFIQWLYRIIVSKAPLFLNIDEVIDRSFQFQ